MKIGIPRERKAGERRVALTPSGAKSLVDNGSVVIVEKDAGLLSAFSDEEFIAAGAKIVPTLAEVWNSCELLVKVKEPAPEEIELFRPGLTVFSFLHLAVAPELTKALVDKQLTGLDYDLVMEDDGRLPILEPMSVVAGKLSIQCGAFALQGGNGGRGVLLGGTATVAPAKVVVIGGGAAGSSAASVALGMGAQTSILEINQQRIEQLKTKFPNARVLESSSESISKELQKADLVIGSVLIPGARAPKLITRQMLSKMQPGSVIVDICIDQGGMAESSQPTTIADPTFLDSGVVHYCVTNMPALVPRTSTEALTNETLPWIQLLAEKGIEPAIKEARQLRRSLTNYKGRLCNEAIGKDLGMKVASAEEIDRLL